MPLPFSFGAGLSYPLIRNSYVGPFEHTNGDLYVVLGNTVSGVIEVWRSTDGGNSWAEQDATNAPAAGIYTSAGVFSAVKDGTSIVVGFADAEGDITEKSFSMATNLWFGGVNQVVYTISASNHPQGTPGLFIAGPRNTDEFVYVYNGGPERIMGVDYYRVYAVVFGAGLTNVGVINPAGGQVHYKAEGALTIGNRTHVFYTSGSTLFHRTITSTNTLGTHQSIDLTIWSATAAIGVPFANGTEIIVPYINSDGALYVARATSADTPTWTTQAVTPTTTSDPEFAGSGAVDGTTVHLFWPDDTTQDIYHDSDGGTGTWGTDTEWKDAVDVSAISVGKITNAIGVVYRDGTTVKYDSFLLGNPPIELDGVATGTSAASAVDISVGHPLEGTAAGSASASAGRLILTHPLSGTAVGTSSATGNLFVPGDALAGASAGVSDASAFGLRLDIPLEGTAIGTASATADILSVGHPLDGTAAGSSDASAAGISVGHPLTGEAAGTSAASADLTTTAVTRLVVYWVELEIPSAAQSHPLDGVSTGTSDASALRLTLEHPLAASTIGVSDASALDLNVGHPLVGESAGLGYAEVPSLNVGHTLSGQTAGLGAAEAGALSVGHPLSSESVGTSDAMASRLEVGHALSGEAVGTSVALAALTVDGDVTLSGTAVGTSSASAILSMAHPLIGTVVGSSAALADSLHVGHALVGTTLGVSDAVAQRISVSHVLEGEALGTSDGLVPTLLVGHALEGAAAGLGFASAQRLRLDMPLLGSSLGYSEAMAGAILVGHVLSGGSLGTSHAFGVLGPVQLRPRSHLVMVG